MIRCIITDDEPLARQGLTDYVKDVDFLQLAGTCANPVELMKLLEQQPVDLVFLDLQMPKMNGLDFLEIVKHPPMVIITTAYPQFAVQGFEFDVLDYLVKPITFERFYASAQRAKKHMTLREGNGIQQHGNGDHVFIKSGQVYEKILLNDILFISAMENYISIVTKHGKHISLMPLKSMETFLSNKPFLRIHKSFLVSLEKIDAIEGYELRVGSHRLPISRNYRDQVMQAVLQKKLIR